MGNKQGELELCMQLQGYDLVAITETSWDNSHDWNVFMDGFVLFRMDRPGRQGSWTVLYMSEQLESMQICLGANKVQVQSQWVRTKGHANTGDLVVGVS